MKLFLYLTLCILGIQASCDSGYYRPFILLPCKPCQEEDVVYFGNNINDYAPIPRELSLADCQNECAKIPTCQYWSYHLLQQKCFLKDHRGDKNQIDYLSRGYISGTKRCPIHKVPSAPTFQTESQIEIGSSKFTFLPSTFGKQFRPGDKLRGKVVKLESKLCSPIPHNVTRRHTIAVVDRGDCQFAEKAINAQVAGYSAVIILDTQNATKFSRLIASANNQIPVSFIRIPILFLLPNQGEKLKLILQESQNFRIESMDPKDILDWFKDQSPLTLAIYGVCALVALILICAIQVCCCSCGKTRRRQRRVLPDTCPSSEASPDEEFDFRPQIPSMTVTENPYNNPMENQLEIQNELCCPVCLDVPLPPKKIFQCSQGHTICDECLTRIEKRCPTCRESWENTNLPVRNRMAESMIFKVCYARSENNLLEVVPQINPVPLEVPATPSPTNASAPFFSDQVVVDLSPSAPPPPMSDEI